MAATRIGLHDPASPLLEKRFTPHCARHFFSTWLYRAGMEERYIAWLRGDAPRGAMGPYVHIDPEDVRKSYLAHVPRLGV
jgi:integrase/recombinase XerD